MQHVVPAAMPSPTQRVSADERRAAALDHQDEAATQSTRDDALRWTVHSAADDPLRTAMLVGVLGVASTLAFEYSASAALGILAFVLLAVSLRSWFLPRHYALDGTGSCESGPLCATRRLAWTDVRSVGRGRFGIYLSTLHTRSRFVRDKGLFLRTTGMRPARHGSPTHDGRLVAVDRDAVRRFVEGATGTPD